MPKNKKRSVQRIDREEGTYFDRLEDDIKSNQNTLSLVLGALIVIVVGILVFNYFNKPKTEISSDNTETAQPAGDVSPTNLPGKYTVKEGDTLFTIAEKYYGDGFKYEEIANANTLADVNALSSDQEIIIPKIEGAVAQASEAPAESEAPAATTQPVAEATPAPAAENPQGTGGADNTIWGAKIEGNSYTVVEGDWLSTIAARAYGDILAYDRIAKENNITDPNIITPGMVLKLSR